MSMQKITIISDININEDLILTLQELAAAVHLKDDLIIEMVELELIQPKQGNEPENWQFDSLSLKRAQTASRFYKDLEINLPGIALALDLLDQIEELQQQIHRLEKFIE